MRTILCSCLFLFFAGEALAEEPPLDDKRLTVHTLVREDIFAGWMSQEMERFARGEKNIDLLLDKRPNSRATLLAWKGGAKLYRAILALEAGDNEKFEREYQEVRDMFAEARSKAPGNGGVAAVVGGSYAVFADRLPEKYRDAAWQESYENYLALWKQQARFVERLPLHIRGELLAGLVQSAQRTGRQQEYDEYLAKVFEVLPGTRYERVAKKWQEDPEAAATGNISCKSCHAPGRLSALLAQNKGK